MKLSLKKITEWLTEGMWEGGSILPRTHTGRFSLRLARLVLAVTRDMQEGHYGQRAASLAYTSLVTFVPLLAIGFSVLKGFGVHDALQRPLRAYLAPLGAGADEAATHIVGFVENVNVGVLGAVGTALLIFGVVSMLQKMEYAFNDIWRVARGRSFGKRIRDYLTVVLLAPLSLFLAVAMTTSLQHADYAWKWLKLDLVDTAMENVFAIVPWVLFIIAFTAFYIFMPNTRVHAKPAVVSATVTAIIWKLLGKLFTAFVVGTASYAAIYSVFAVLALFMIWVYAGWLVILIGASVCYYLQHPSNQPIPRHVRGVSLRMKEKMALQACAAVGHSFYKEQKGLELDALAAALKAPLQTVQDVVDNLAVAGVLVLAGSQYVPARPFDTTTVDEMMRALRAADEFGVLQAHKVAATPSVATVIKISDKALHDKLDKFTLKQLALGSIDA
ncbi:MAG: YihY/virulence factor BrkB family protein [Alphaproteobacteria bacterium]